MNSAAWVIPTTIGIIIAIPLATLIGYLIFDAAKARGNRAYKTLQEHSILNAGSREDWMTGTLPSGEVKELSRFSTIVAPLVQLTTTIILALVIVISTSSLKEQAARQEDQISDLEAQVHALAFASTKPSDGSKLETDPAAPFLPPTATQMANPMQQACANLIGRVADAYEKGESSKIGESLEELVKKLKCVNGAPP
jgi:hypothetical protein